MKNNDTIVEYLFVIDTVADVLLESVIFLGDDLFFGVRLRGMMIHFLCHTKL